MDRIDELRWLLEGLGRWFERLQLRPDELRDRERAAIGAYLRALEETGPHLEGESGAGAEEEIARLWMGAADAVRDLDADLATRCATKARQWPGVVTWSADEVREARGEIRALARAAERLHKS